MNCPIWSHCSQHIKCSIYQGLSETLPRCSENPWLMKAMARGVMMWLSGCQNLEMWDRGWEWTGFGEPRCTNDCLKNLRWSIRSPITPQNYWNPVFHMITTNDQSYKWSTIVNCNCRFVWRRIMPILQLYNSTWSPLRAFVRLTTRDQSYKDFTV